MCDKNNCCDYCMEDFTLIDFDEIKKEIAELRELIQQQKREQERIALEQWDLQTRIDILHLQLKSMR